MSVNNNCVFRSKNGSNGWICCRVWDFEMIDSCAIHTQFIINWNRDRCGHLMYSPRTSRSQMASCSQHVVVNCLTVSFFILFLFCYICVFHFVIFGAFTDCSWASFSNFWDSVKGFEMNEWKVDGRSNNKNTHTHTTARRANDFVMCHKRTLFTFKSKCKVTVFYAFSDIWMSVLIWIRA